MIGVILIPAELQCDFIKFDAVFITIEEEDRRKRKECEREQLHTIIPISFGGLIGVGSVLEREKERERGEIG